MMQMHVAWHRHFEMVCIDRQTQCFPNISVPSIGTQVCIGLVWEVSCDHGHFRVLRESSKELGGNIPISWQVHRLDTRGAPIDQALFAPDDGGSSGPLFGCHGWRVVSSHRGEGGVNVLLGHV